MSTHTIKGYLYHVQYDYQERHEFQVVFNDSAAMPKASPDWVLLREHEFTVEVPDDFDPRPAKVACLQEMQRKVRAEMMARVNELQEQINKLTALEFEPSETAL